MISSSSSQLFKHGSRCRRRLLIQLPVAYRSASLLSLESMIRYNSKHGSLNVKNFASSANRRYMATMSSMSMDNRSSSSVSSSSGAKQQKEQQKEQQQQQLLNPMPDFANAQAAYATKTTQELLRAALVFSLCRIPPLVRNAERMLNTSRRVLGDGFTDFVLKQTMFGHFCAGENETTIVPTIRALERAGIGSILDFAAEDDGGGSQQHITLHTNTNKISLEASDEPDVYYDHYPHQHQVVVMPKAKSARVYDYESEAKCDAHVATFKRCIQHVSNLGPDGFAAIKVTALGNPKLLERMSRAIVETQNLFAKFDVNGDGIISRDEFEQGFKVFFHDDDQQKFRLKLDEMNAATNNNYNYNSSNDNVDYITWSMTLSPSDLPQITSRCRDVGPLALATPTAEEVELIENLYARGHALAQEAAACGTRLLVDAEQLRFQPAIDNLVLELQRKHNSVVNDNNNAVVDFPIIYNTYQCYLKDAPKCLATDVERSERFQYHFGAKLVRGAYMEGERALAKLHGYPSPIHDSIQETHDCYNGCVNFLLQHAAAASSSSKSSSNKKKRRTEMMLATHNQQSIENAIEAMNAYGISRQGGSHYDSSSSSSSSSIICFGQLLGMADNLSFNLGKHGYRAYKYVPYGEIKMVMPYLIRRANENSSLAGGGAAQELSMIKNELKRRLFGFLGFA